MSDVNAAVAESSPVTAPEPIEVEDFTEAQRDAWQRTGELPAKEIKPSEKEESATSKKDAVKKDDAAPSKAAKEKPTKEENFRTLEADRNRERERANGLEARIKALESGKTDVKQSAESSSALIEKPAAPAKPKRVDFASDEDYEKAYEAEYLPKKLAFDAATKTFEKQMEAINSRHQSLNEKWKGIKAEGEKLYGEDGWKKAADAFEEHAIFSGDPFEVYVRESEPVISAHFMQYMSLKPKDVERITKLPPGKQWAELYAIETAMREELKLDAAAPPTEKAKDADEKPRPKLVSSSLPPPREVGGKGTASEDEETVALREAAAGNPQPYMDLTNRRELAKRRVSRRA